MCKEVLSLGASVATREEHFVEHALVALHTLLITTRVVNTHAMFIAHMPRVSQIVVFNLHDVLEPEHVVTWPVTLRYNKTGLSHCVEKNHTHIAQAKRKVEQSEQQKLCASP